MCKCCEGKNNYHIIGVKMEFDGRFHIYMASGFKGVPESDKIKFCPACGAWLEMEKINETKK